MAGKSFRANANPLATMGTNRIKKRIRDLERLLTKRKDTLPDTVLIEKERVLDGLKHELNQSELNQKMRKNAKKYHMVRFFERKKAFRRYKNALKKNDNNKDILEKCIDLCYVVNFPQMEKYVSIYPNNESDSSKTHQKRESFRSIIAKQLENRTLPVPLEDILQGKRQGRNTAVAIFERQSSNEETPPSKVEKEEDEFFE